MAQVYFPKPGRKMWLPTMLHKKQLPSVLARRTHVEVLGVAGAQCDPDSHDYIRVSGWRGSST